MHPNLLDPLQLVRRRCLPDHTIPLLPSFHNPLPGSLPDLFVVELRAQDFLHPELAVYYILDDEDICADEGKGEGLEVWRRLFDWECTVGATSDVDF